MLPILIFICAFQLNAAKFFTLYGDVLKDKEFFINIYPWLIDNLGGYVNVEYQLLGSGRYSIPQMCALQQINRNTFLQAQYLKCEAEGKDSRYCLCEAGIDAKEFKECVKDEGYLSSHAYDAFSKLNIGVSPLIETDYRGTVFGVTADLFLRKICSIFGDYPPIGCVQACNMTEEWISKKPIAQFDRDCDNSFPKTYYYETTTGTPA